MGKKKDKNNPLDMLQLDIQYRDRQLAAELAMHNAEMAYKQKYMEMIDLPGLEESKRQFALEYALSVSELDWKKEMATREFGESQRQFDISAQLDRERLQLDQNAEAFRQKIQEGQFALDEAAVTGFYQGKPTQQAIQFEKEFGLKQAQTVLNAPRGPADYHAYINRLTGLQNAGANLPGVVGQLMSGAGMAGASTGAMQGAMPMSNTQFATQAVYGQGAQPNPATSPPNPAASADLQANAPMFSAAAGAGQNATGIAPPGGFPGGVGSPNAVRGGTDVNYREWNRLSPVTQQYVTGYAEEELGQPAEDFLWGIARGAPGTESASGGRSRAF